MDLCSIGFSRRFPFSDWVATLDVDDDDDGAEEFSPANDLIDCHFALGQSSALPTSLEELTGWARYM